MWLSDGLPGAPQPTPSSGGVPAAAPMPTIAEEEGSPDKQPNAGPHEADPPSRLPSQHAATAPNGLDSAPAAALAAPRPTVEPTTQDVSSSFSFQPSLSLHGNQDTAPAAVQEAPAAGTSARGPPLARSLFDESNSSTNAESVAQLPASRALSSLPETASQDRQASGEGAAPVGRPLSSSDVTADGLRALQLPSQRQPCLETRLVGSWEGLEHVGLEPLPSGGTSPDTAGAPRSRLGPSGNEHVAHDDSLDGSRIPRLSFPGFVAGGPNESRDQSLTSSTPKFSPKQHFSLRESHAIINPALTPHQFSLDESAELPTDLSGSAHSRSMRSSEPHQVKTVSGTSTQSECDAMPFGPLDRRPIGNLGDSCSFSGRSDSDSTFAPPMSTEQLQDSASGQVGSRSSPTGSPRRSSDISRGISAADGGGSNRILRSMGDSMFQSRSAADERTATLQGMSAADGGVSPVGRRSLEARRESMLRALSGGSSRSSSGDLSGSLQPQLFTNALTQVSQVRYRQF